MALAGVTGIAMFVIVASPARAVNAASISQVVRWGGYSGDAFVGDTQRSPTGLANLTSDVVAIDASNDSSYALACVGGAAYCATDGTVWAWGNGHHGELGNGTFTGWSPTAVQVAFPPGVAVVSIGEAKDSGYAVDANGQGWEWGQRHCRVVHPAAPKSVPQMVFGMSGASAVQGASGYVIWLMADGTVKACGDNSSGQLGNGTMVTRTKPASVLGLSNIVQISAGMSVEARDATGGVWAWGLNTYGQAGVGSPATVIMTPTLIHLPAPALLVSSGGDMKTMDGHAFALLDNGQLWGWGADARAQLGDGLRVSERSPVPVPVPIGVTFSSVVAAGQHSLALDSTGGVWAWGWGGAGQLGTGTMSSFVHPVRVDLGTVAISATANNSIDLHQGGDASPTGNITKVQPNLGTAKGGNVVTIIGTNFAGATRVMFGTTAATSFWINAAVRNHPYGTRITAVAPAATAGIVDITVITPSGTSPVSVGDEYALLG